MLSALIGEHLAGGGMAVLTSHQSHADCPADKCSAMNAMLAIIRRDLLLAMRRKSEVLTALFFFVIVVSLFPLGIGPEPALLKKIAPGVLWVAALLATMLALQRACSPPTMPTARSSRWCCRRRRSACWWPVK